MKIDNLKINGFGKLQNKDISLKPGINLIYGKNESGKSTLLNFITSMLYGMSRNKNGKEISNFEKYKPWNAAEYSGKLQYQLDNNQKYEIFREFSKKSPKLYNEDLEEISANYNKDKSKGAEFFFEQTKISENMLMKTAVVEQEEVKLDKADQNSILQKISNMVSTGNSKNSFQKTIDNLDKKQTKEIGTNRTTGRPINIVKEQIEDAKAKIKELEQYRERQVLSNSSKENLQNDLETIVKEIEVLKKIKVEREKEYIEKHKIELLQKDIKELEDKIQNITEKSSINLLPKKEKINIKKILLVFLMFIITIISYIFVPQKIVTMVFLAITVVFMIIVGISEKKRLEKNKNEIDKLKEEIIALRKEEEILEKEKEKRKEELTALNETNSKNIEKMFSDIKYRYLGEVEISILEKFLNMEYREIESALLLKEDMYNKKTLEVNSINVTNSNFNEMLEELTEAEEKLLIATQELEELEYRNSIMNLTRSILEEAYEKMKQNITPQFTTSLTNIVNKITNGKYTNVKFNDVEGLLVETQAGDYVKCERLSIGTIDQMYLSLRLATLTEVTDETIPLIFDETFVYYDDERLKNVLEFVKNEFAENQIIILTCSNREKDMLDELNVEYNLVEL